MNIILFEKGVRHFECKDERLIHIKKVLHMGVGDSFHGGEINGWEGKCRIENFDSDGLDFAFTPVSDTSALHPLTMIVAQVRPICMKRILREAVSLGVGRLILPISDLGEKSYASASLYTEGEYKSIRLDGAMQSGKTGVSECLVVKGVEEAIEKAGEGERLLLDNVIGSSPLSSLDLKNKSVILAIGPERGWSERERKLFLSSSFSPVLIGDRILRTETAAVAAPSVALSRMGLL